MHIIRAMKNDRTMKAVTGLTVLEFEMLLVRFIDVSLAHQSDKPRKRAPGAGRKGALKTLREKLFFLLFYMRVYPTCDLAGVWWGVDRSRICRWVQEGLPLLQKALEHEMVLPERKVSSMEDFMRHFPEAWDLMIDGTERMIQRPSSARQRDRCYSGKQHAYTRKNLMVTDPDRRVLMLSATKNGKRHDHFRLLQTHWLSSLPPGTTLWVDKGFIGIEKYLPPGVTLMRPQKKSKHAPLSPAQQSENRTVSAIRMVCEHTISGIKRFKALSHPYRNRKGQDDSFMLLASGLWNFHLRLA